MPLEDHGLRAGATVHVTNLDGETANGKIVAILATTTEEHEIEVGDRETPISLYDYWRGQCDPDAPVVEVKLGAQVYDYPADKIEVLE